MFSIRQLGAIGRTYKHLNRYHRILRVLFKYGFDDLVDHLHIDQYLETGLQMINRKPREQIEKHSRAVRLRMVLEELGPTFIKLGQLLSTRPDFIPPDYLAELTKLQDNVPPFSFTKVKSIFQNEFKQNPEELFASFSETPLAAASIGQVHRAKLQDGTELVVKIQRPDIDKIIAIDLEILAHLANLMEQYLEELQGHRPTAIVHEFARSISREIDFTIELSNIRRFSRQFENNPTIHVPHVFPQFCSERILTMEYINGIKASNTKMLQEKGLNLPLLAKRGTKLIMAQIFNHGFFHADPHPGNIFFMPNNQVCFIDFGQMGRLTVKDREDFTDLILGIVSGNQRKVVDGVLKLTIQHHTVNREALSLDLEDLMDRFLYIPLGELHVSKMLQLLLELVSRHKIYFKPNMYLMMKSLSTVESVGKKLDPNLQIISLAEPFLKKIKTGRMRPGRLAEEFEKTGTDYLGMLRGIPEEVQVILGQLRDGKMKIEFEHRGLTSFQAALDRISNRISFAIVLASQIIGSSLIILSDIPPKWNDIPLIGLGGFIVAGIMAFRLLLSIIKHGRM